MALLPGPAAVIALGFVCGILVVWKHRGNADRLLHGTERKLSFHKKKEDKA